MKKIFLALAFSFFIFQIKAGVTPIETPVNPYASSFHKAYILNPSVPKGILETVALTQSRFYHLNENHQPSCIGYPQTYGVMGLVEDGKSYFRNNLITISQLSGYSETDIKQNPETNILAFARAFSVLQQQKNIYGNHIENYAPILLALSELPLSNQTEQDFVLNTHLYQIFWLMSLGECQDAYHFPDYHINLKLFFGSNYPVLSSSSVTIQNQTIISNPGAIYRSTNSSLSVTSTDYPPAIWNPAASCNYSSRSGTAISAVTIHDVEGTYAGCISWFQNCSASVSAHYVLRSSDGQVTQMVLEADKAWHVGSENPYTVGLEHEGYNSSASWYTTAMYQSSADLVRDICSSNSINPLRTYYGPGCSGSSSQCALGACTKVKGHQMYPNQTHDDPGPYWNWDLYYKLINNAPAITTVTTTTGNFYDSGGSGANYQNDERKLWLFQPSGASSISMTFSSFDLENHYDYMFIYDGSTVNSPLIGKYTGSVNPGPIQSTGGSLLIEFRSDCATTATGWAATYTTSISTPTTADIIAPTTSVTTANAWKTTTFTSTFTDADNSGGSGVEKGYYQVLDYNGTEWRANYTHGFFADNFDNAIHPEWTVKTGTWNVTGNTLVQSDETTTDAANTNMYAALTQTLSNRYLYNFLAKFEGSGTSRRAGFHFFCDSPDSVNRGNSYFVWFRLDNQAVQLYKTGYSGGVNVFGSPTYTAPVSFNAGQWYDIKVIYDRITGKMFVYMNNALIAQWQDLNPLTTGSYISFRSGNCKFSIDEIKVYRSRSSSANITLGTGNGYDIRYQNPNPLTSSAKIKSICQDSAGNLSAIYYHDLNVDWTNPSNVTYVYDGKSADIAVVNTTDSLSANWPSSIDANSGIAKYWYSIGTSPGATNTLTWTSSWADTLVTVHGLTLTNGTTYYFNIKSENGAGLFSNVVSSNGQLVNMITTSVTETSSSNILSVYPNPVQQNLEVIYHLEFDSKVSISIINALGQELTSIELKESQGTHHFQFNLSALNLSAGVYWIKLNQNNSLHYQKFVKE